MNKHTVLFLPLISITLLFSGCGGSPNARFYILNAIDQETSVPALIVEGHSITVKIGPVSIPDALDQPQVVSRTGKNTLLADEFNRWAGDFQYDIQRILGENISILLPTNQVTLSQEIILFPVDFQVIVNVRKFDGKLGDIVILNADWTVARKGKEKTVMARKSVLHEHTRGADYQAYVATQSRLLAKLSQEIADEIRKQLQQ
ncbi:MAG: hypothetical protein GQ582_02335 [Methyloprofundus sp.]|nr:hypothetical protein [Methyloprofundus sp.]